MATALRMVMLETCEGHSDGSRKQSCGTTSAIENKDGRSEFLTRAAF
jgi:hypothetical protein